MQGIEERFRDLKGLLGMGRVMNKRQDYMEKMLALLLLVYAVGQKWHVSPLRWRAILNTALAAFLAIVHSPVPT